MKEPVEEQIFLSKIQSILDAPFIPTREKKVREWRIGEILLEDHVITHSPVTKRTAKTAPVDCP